MKIFFKEYGSFLVYSLIAILLLGFLLFGMFTKHWGEIKVDDQWDDVSAAFTKMDAKSYPQLEVTDCRVAKGTAFNIYDTIKANDEKDGDITSKVEMEEISSGTSKLKKNLDGTYSLSTAQIGTSIIEVSVTNSRGFTQSDVVIIIVYSKKT